MPDARIEFLNPVAEVAADPTPYANWLDTSQAGDVALLANSFPESARFLECLKVELERQGPELLSYSVHDKGATRNASIPLRHLDSDIGDTLSVGFRGAITAYGH